jgi:beta-galactosidase
MIIRSLALGIVGLSVALAGCQVQEAGRREGASETRAQAQRVIPATPLMVGVAWYPEQFPESAWEKDLQLMQDAGIRMVRIGEFAWSTLEPAEGRYELGWLDRAVAAAAKHGMRVVLCTPTDAPPAWMSYNYPDILRVDENGVRLRHGGRRQFSYTSPRYRTFCRKIVEQLADRFGHNPHVVGWQIGNEYTDDSNDESAKKLFAHWLAARYPSIDALNEHWATAYWSQTYFSFDQVPLPNSRDNPALQLEYKHFVTDNWRSFQRNQIDAIRAHLNPERLQFVTTNLGGLGWADKFDRWQICQDLDMISWDTYIGNDHHLEPYKIGATHDLVRGWKQKNFWVMETQPGSVNWAGVNNTLDRGETREVAWQAVGHGADCVAYWQWRSAPNGQEEYHGCLVGPDGNPLPIYQEIRQIGQEFEKAAPALAGTSPVSEVALLHDYDSRWAIDFQPHSNRYDQLAVLVNYYRALRDKTQSVDIVNPRVDLNAYKLVVAPSLNVISEPLAAHLLEYVRQGGHLVLGPRSGMKDQYDALDPRRQPGPLAPALGGRVEQFYALLQDVPVSGPLATGSVSIWGEQLSARDAQVILRYGKGGSGGWLDDQPAAITKVVGKGRITYIGGLLDNEALASAAKWMLEQAAVQPAVLEVPAGIEVCRRVGSGGRQVYVVMNHGSVKAQVKLLHAMHDVLKGEQTSGFELEPHGVAVLENRS